MQKLKRGPTRARPVPARLPLTAAICLAFTSTIAFAQEVAQAPPEAPQQTTEQAVSQQNQAVTLGTVNVTAQKRVENLQKVPISIQAIGTEQLEQQNVADFDDYAKMIPSLSYGTAGGGVFSGPGFVQVYMRGVASGGDGNHSGSQPSVGMYLDEQPITTIQGALDIHMYDIERVEALAGPQGTLYGASSQAGTVRIITRKPDPSGFAGSYSVEASAIDGGGIGHVLEGMVNVPIHESAAIRLVGWEKHDAGYVDNVLGSRTFPSWDADSGGNGTVTNERFAEDDYNEADTYGLRAALKVDLGDNWSITPSVITQKMDAHGSTGYDKGIGDLEVMHNRPESSDDRWTQAALTVEGKIGNFDVTYAFSHLKRDVDSEADYSDYAFWYDTLRGYGSYFYDNDGALIDPTQYIQATDGYRKTSHELRIASPSENRIRFVAGLFWQRQTHDIFQRYRIDNLADALEVPGWSDTLWLTSQQRNDRDEAIFGELSFDITDKLSATGGLRHFRTSNGLKGFFGFGDGYSGSTGVSQCFSDEPFHGAPCTNLDKDTDESGSIGRVNLTYNINDTKLVYATWSEGFRPGGINRRGTLPPYTSDVLTNYELGWKTSWGENRFRWNGAVFREDWKDFQFSYLGQNGLTEIRNANQARVNGLETDLSWAASYNLSLTGGFAWYDAKLTEPYCQVTNADGSLDPTCLLPMDPNDSSLIIQNGGTRKPDFAAAGTRLPITPKFKGNLNARYTFDMAGGEAYWQIALSHVGERTSDLREYQRYWLGDLDAYTLTDLSAGYRRGSWSLDFFLKNAFDERTDLARFSECAAEVCGHQPYTVTSQPRTFGVRFSQEF
jgi:outer membrane receptor protein involved in Fe transport